MTTVNFLTLLTTPLHNFALPKKTEINGYEYHLFQTQENFQTDDTFVSNPLQTAFKGRVEIENMARSNPRIVQLCKEYGIPIQANIEELEALRRGHLQNTRVLAAKICSNMK